MAKSLNPNNTLVEIDCPPKLTWFCHETCKSKGPFILTNPKCVSEGEKKAEYMCIRCSSHIILAKEFWPMLRMCNRDDSNSILCLGNVLLKVTWIPSINTQKSPTIADVDKTSQNYEVSVPKIDIFENNQLWIKARNLLSTSGKNPKVNFVFHTNNGQRGTVWCGNNPSDEWKTWQREDENVIVLDAVEWENE